MKSHEINVAYTITQDALRETREKIPLLIRAGLEKEGVTKSLVSVKKYL